MADNQADAWICPDCGESVDSSALGFLADVTCPKCGKEGHAHTQLANYRLESILGIGGMSVVMRAYDPALGRPVAIKLLNDDYRDQEDRIRKFESECSLMAKVRHENVVSVYSAGWARGQFYIAMELVDGENLEFIIDRRKFLLPNQAVEIIRQVALGLKAAHEAGLLHRDVKPGNVIITKNKQAKVLDFGLSMENHQDEEDKEEIIWATPFYVPPETLRREREDVRSDIYALGMTLRNLLTGEDKLHGEFHSVSSLLELKETYPSMRSTYPHLDVELCDFVDRMSAFKPDDRPGDYNEVLAELAEVAEHLSKVGQRRATRMWLAEKRREMMILGGAAVLGIILATTVVCSTTVQVVQRYINVPAECSVQDWQDITKAENTLLSAKWKEAAKQYAALAERAQDPAVGARAGLMGAALLTMQSESAEGAAQCIACAGRHLDAAKADKLLAQGNWQEMEQALQMVKAEEIPDAEAFGGLDQPMLRTVAYLLTASRAMDMGLTDEAQDLAEKAASLAENSSGGLREMSTILNRYKLDIAHRAVPMLRERLQRLLAGGKLDEARQCMQRLSKMELTSGEKAELEVQQELAMVARAAFDAFRKHGEDPELAVSDPLSFHDAARKVKKDPTFANEMTCLAHMLHGEYSKAFTVNPYRNNVGSQKPFAVLMRSWRQKLEQP